MNVFNFVLSVVVLVASSSCSTTTGSEKVDPKRFDYKAPPATVRSLEVPPDLTSFSGDDRFGIPGDSESGTSYLDFSKGGAKRKANSVLPPVRNVRIERKDGKRWLVVDDKAENVWPVVKVFWQENGLPIKVENPQVGILETEWAENRAKIPMDGFRKLFGKVFDGLISSGESDQYHTRLERSKDGNSTEIYITHYGMQEVAEKDDKGFRWIPRPNDPELEATMLQLLMSKLGGGSGVLDNSRKLPLPEGDEAGASITLSKLADGSQSILFGEAFDKSWRKVGLALEKAGLILSDKDRSKGTYYLSVGKEDGKTKTASEKAVRVLVIVREVGAGCEIVVNNLAGTSNAETQKILDAIYKSLSRI